MLIYMDSGYNLVATVPDHTGQYSSGYNVLWVVGDIAPATQMVAAYRLPDGTYATQYVGQNSTTKADGFPLEQLESLPAWKALLPASVLAQDGTVRMTLYVYTGASVEGQTVTPSSPVTRTVDFRVTQAVPLLLPGTVGELTASESAANLLADILTALKAVKGTADNVSKAVGTPTVPADGSTPAVPATGLFARMETAEGDIDSLESAVTALSAKITADIAAHNRNGAAHEDIRLLLIASDTKAEQAVSTAAQAVSAANSAKSVADTAAAQVKTAYDKAVEVNSLAAEAKTAAEGAKATASGAVDTANQALTVAENIRPHIIFETKAEMEAYIASRPKCKVLEAFENGFSFVAGAAEAGTSGGQKVATLILTAKNAVTINIAWQMEKQQTGGAWATVSGTTTATNDIDLAKGETLLTPMTYTPSDGGTYRFAYAVDADKASVSVSDFSRITSLPALYADEEDIPAGTVWPIKAGLEFWLEETGVPDYWWDGWQAVENEAAVPLEEYVRKDSLTDGLKLNTSGKAVVNPARVPVLAEDGGDGYYVLWRNQNRWSKLVVEQNWYTSGTLPIRDANGNIYLKTPTYDYHAATKGYADGKYQAAIDYTKFAIAGLNLGGWSAQVEAVAAEDITATPTVTLAAGQTKTAATEMSGTLTLTTTVNGQALSATATEGLSGLADMGTVSAKVGTLTLQSGQTFTLPATPANTAGVGYGTSGFRLYAKKGTTAYSGDYVSDTTDSPSADDGTLGHYAAKTLTEAGTYDVYLEYRGEAQDFLYASPVKTLTVSFPDGQVGAYGIAADFTKSMDSTQGGTGAGGTMTFTRTAKGFRLSVAPSAAGLGDTVTATAVLGTVKVESGKTVVIPATRAKTLSLNGSDYDGIDIYVTNAAGTALKGAYVSDGTVVDGSSGGTIDAGHRGPLTLTEAGTYTLRVSYTLIGGRDDNLLTVLTMDLAKAQATFVLAANTEHRVGTADTVTVTLSETPGAGAVFRSALVLDAATTAPTLTLPAVCVMTGDNCTGGVFTPVSGKRYRVEFNWDGAALWGNVLGRSAT